PCQRLSQARLSARSARDIRPISEQLALMCVAHYRVRHVRRRGARHPPAGAAARHRRARLPAAAQEGRLRLRPHRRPRAARLRDRRQHALPAPAAPRETRAADLRVGHRRGAPPQVLPHERRRSPPRRHPQRRMAHPRHRIRLPEGHVMTTTDYTDRYVSAVVRGVPERQRADLEKELRASLADDIDARIEAGADHATAEYAAIQALGDPIVLSAHYAGRPLHLVGPALYADWKRLLTALELIIVPIV